MSLAILKNYYWKKLIYYHDIIASRKFECFTLKYVKSNSIVYSSLFTILKLTTRVTMDKIQTNRYSAVAIFFHWAIAIMIFFNFATGLLFNYNHSKYIEMIALHKQSGVFILGLVILRLLWRFTHRYPSLTGEIPFSEKVLAYFGHVVMYLLMLIIPVAGILFVQGYNHNLIVCGYKLPKLLNYDMPFEQAERLQHLHESLAIFLATLVAGHIIAALKHHFIDKNQVLTRILPHFGKRKK